MVNTFDAHIGYIIPTKCPTYSAIVKTEDDRLYDIDASGHFLHLPVKIGIGEDYVNHLEVSLNAVSETDDFQAIPFCIWKKRPSSRSNFLGKNILHVIGAHKNIFKEHDINWLGPTSNEKFSIALSVGEEPNNQSDVDRDFQKACLTQDPWFCKVDRPNFEYKLKSWFVAYALPPFASTNDRRLERLSYRLVDDIEILHHGNHEKYNFFKADAKVFQESQVLFYKKIYNIWDWIYCIKLLKHYFWNPVNSPR